MPMFPCLNISTIRPVPLAEKIPLIADAGFRAGVARFLEQECQAVAEDIEAVAALGPFKRLDN